MSITQKIYSRIRALSPLETDLLLTFGILILILVIIRNILFIGPFQSSDLDVGWIGIHGVSELFYPWNFENLGSPNSPAGSFFIFSYTSLLLGAGAGEKLIYYSSLSAAPLFAYFLTRDLGVQRRVGVLLSLIYLFNPWFIGEFMTGEPAFTWTYAILPLVVLFIHRIFRNPKNIASFAGLSLVLGIASMFTFQALIIYSFLVAPFLLGCIFNRSYPMRLFSLVGIVVSVLIAIAMNLFSLEAYLSASNQLISSSLTNLNSLFGGFSSVAAIALKPWILSLFVVSLFLFVFSIRKSNGHEKAFLISTVAFQAFFLIVYFAIPSRPIAAIYIHFPLFTPFQNYDKFLLMPTFYLTSLLFLASKSPSFQGSSLKSVARREKRKALYFIGKAVPYVAVILLLSAFLFSSIQPAYSEDNGVHFLEGNFSFPNNQIPNQYFELRSFLLSNGVNFSLSAHVLVVPQNPGDILPFYVGETIIPGFIGPTPYLYNIIQNISSNESLATTIMSLLGIKYVALLSDPGDSSWPGATGSISEGGWGGGNFPQGNISAYSKILESWPTLEKVFSINGLTILYNKEYVGNSLFWKEDNSSLLYFGIQNITTEEVIDQITNGNYLNLYNQMPTGTNLIRNPDLLNYSDWSFKAGNGKAILMSNGTVELEPGSTGASLSQPVTLLPNKTYELKIYVKTDPGYNGFPPNGDNRNYIGIYWNSGTGFNGTPGASINGYFNGNYTGERTFIFTTPASEGNINASFQLDYEPPVGNRSIFTTYSNVSLFTINGSIIFKNIVKPYDLNAATPYDFSAPHSDPSGGYVLIDTSYNPRWYAVTNNGSIISSIQGPLGLLEFHLKNDTKIVSIRYSGSETYLAYVYVGWSIFLASVALYVACIVFIHPRGEDKRRLRRLHD
ncbi:MAG: hypothetical protein QW292_14035 [Candidatus Parvarchaeota archaeon]